MFSVGPPEFHPHSSGPPAALSTMPTAPMEMAGEYAELNIVAIDGSPRYAANSVHFDASYELLWVGNQGGHMTSYFGPSAQKYTSFQIHPRNYPVVEILSIGERVLGLTKDTLRCSLNRGLPVFTFKNEILQDTQCMTMRKETNVLLAGKNSALVEVDLNTVSISNSIPQLEDEGTAIFRTTSKYLCCGGFNGKVMLRDPDSLKIQHTLDAHSGTISDFDASGHTLITCGFSQRPGSGGNGSHLSLDRYVKMYDLRMMRALTPIQCAIQPSFLRFLSTYTRRMLVVSQSGQFLLIEDNATVTPNTPIYQANLPGTSIINIDVSSSTQGLAFGDSGGCLHLWSASTNPSFNHIQKSPEFGTFCQQGEPTSIDDLRFSLSMIPMPRTQEPLFSDWPAAKCVPVSRRPPPIDPDLLRTMKVIHGIGYAPNPGNRRRNQVPYKLKDMSIKDQKGKKAAVPDSPLGRDEQPHLYMVPKKYRKVVFKYSKLGEEENEMIQHYNKTNFAGLEPNIPNAYCNCMLQILYFIEPLRCGLQSHHNLNKEFDLAEELGFLFHMQDSARSGVLQASNFLRAFRTIPEATALGLLKNSSKPEQITSGGANSNLAQLIQSWHRFILQQLHTETLPTADAVSDNQNLIIDSPNDDVFTNKQETGNTEKDMRSLVEKLFGTEVKIFNQFRNGQTSERKTVQFLFNLTYSSLTKPGESLKYVPFSNVIKNSISSQIHTKSWDKASETYQPLIQTKTPTTLPDILALNCSLHREEDCQFWKSQSELFSEKVERLAANKESNRRSSIKENRPKSNKPTKTSSNSSDAWNVFAETEGLDLSFEKTTTASWVPLNLTMLIDSDGQLIVQSDNDSDFNEVPKDISKDPSALHYELFATVAHIDDPRTGGNLVAHVNVGKKYHQRKEGVTHTQWYLFNDFQISSIDKEDSVDFDLKWKVPCVFYYKRVDVNGRHRLQVDFPLTSDILLPTPSISKGMRRHLSSSIDQLSPKSAMTFTPLSEEEIPKDEGILVALDAEFVTLNAEEAELHSDGTRSTIKPSHLLLARVTVVRGEGALEGEPFIDDYIATQEQVVDYLTKFSGIKPGDLDVMISSKHLSTLKLTYCKLRYLIQCGCVIVGHGLSKDFKVINIYVPDNQIRDTVHLFHMPRKRFISLRFLAWYFLKEKIQKDMHDSIEDARTALKLYRKYLELTSSDEKLKEFKQSTLKKLYDEGRRLEWKVPEEEPAG